MSSFESLLPPSQIDAASVEFSSSAILILRELKAAIDHKYEGKLWAVVKSNPSEEIEDESGEPDKELIATNFFLVAKFGRGYYYKLLELRQKVNGKFPATVILYGEKTKSVNCSDIEAFKRQIEQLISTVYIQELISNLLIHVDAVA